jgi:RNA polymerase II-associated factor 1
VEQEVPNEFLLVIDDGASKGEDVTDGINGHDVRPRRQRSKGAYYKNIERKMTLKKKRAAVR